MLPSLPLSVPLGFLQWTILTLFKQLLISVGWSFQVMHICSDRQISLHVHRARSATSFSSFFWTSPCQLTKFVFYWCQHPILHRGSLLSLQLTWGYTWTLMNSRLLSWYCALCPDSALDPLGHHAATCKHGSDAVLWHNKLRGIMVESFHQAHFHIQVEVGSGLSH